MMQKEYLAYVDGHCNKEYVVEAGLCANSDYEKSKHKMYIDNNGQYSKTKVVPIKYDKDSNTTLVKAIPYTGRTHQIRVHLNYINHPILGEPLYNQPFEISRMYLDNELSTQDRIKYTKASRVQLHSHRLKFCLNNQNYNIKSDFLL
jgi:23S rRNA pseudouridine1911/1915/1917 synthase